MIYDSVSSLALELLSKKQGEMERWKDGDEGFERGESSWPTRHFEASFVPSLITHTSTTNLAYLSFDNILKFTHEQPRIHIGNMSAIRAKLNIPLIFNGEFDNFIKHLMAEWEVQGLSLGIIPLSSDNPPTYKTYGTAYKDQAITSKVSPLFHFELSLIL